MPVLIKAHDVEFKKGANDAQFQVISVLPDQDVGDILHHGAYETTKARITDAASNNGYFDAYWRLHDVKVARARKIPQRLICAMKPASAISWAMWNSA